MLYIPYLQRIKYQKLDKDNPNQVNFNFFFVKIIIL